MNHIIKRKTVTTAISIEQFDNQLTNLDASATPQRDKLQIAKKVLQIPEGFTDNIEIIPNGEYVVFKWHPERYDERAEKLHKNALSLARAGNLNDAVKRWTQASLINPNMPSLPVRCTGMNAYRGICGARERPVRPIIAKILAAGAP